MKLNAVVISNAIEGIDNMFKSNDLIDYTLYEIQYPLNPDFSKYDILIVPNGSDNIALFRMKDMIAEFLNAGKVMFCFDGWFTAWVPGNQWVMDNEHKTIDIRYHIESDKHEIMKGIDLQKLIFSHGISGWWACGHIEANPAAEVIIADTWNRPIVVIDEVSTKGLMVLTASAPMADMLFGTNDEGQDSWGEVGNLYQNLIKMVIPYKKSNQLKQNTVS